MTSHQRSRCWSHVDAQMRHWCFPRCKHCCTGDMLCNCVSYMFRARKFGGLLYAPDYMYYMGRLRRLTLTPVPPVQFVSNILMQTMQPLIVVYIIVRKELDDLLYHTHHQKSQEGTTRVWIALLSSIKNHCYVLSRSESPSSEEYAAVCWLMDEPVDVNFTSLQHDFLRDEYWIRLLMNNITTSV